MACFMAKGNQFWLAIPVLSNIYCGLNIIAKSKTPSDAKMNFPFHSGLLFLSFPTFNTHYPVAQDLKGPRMVKYSGEGRAKYYVPKEIERLIQTSVVTWSSKKLQLEELYSFVDNEKSTKSDLSYFISLRIATKELRRATLDDEFKQWLSCVSTRTYRQATFSTHETKFCTTKGCDKWLEESYSVYMKQSSLLPPIEGNMNANDLGI
ncbi:hypothetical protein LIER_15521 [Lithospermum erythrorhizon]|uniref:Uncharacterized protein n=1 Tax=Lithospermum erythrorhizon TaxID=34254 RepID=A0AAV3Q563_LITER